MTKPFVGGKPLKFKTRQELIDVINEYFKKEEFEDYSVTGLALAVGSKQLIQDYEEREDFGDIIKEAKLIVENSYELDLRKNGGAHNIFALKNFGWKDKTEVENKVHMTDLSDEKAKKVLSTVEEVTKLNE